MDDKAIARRYPVTRQGDAIKITPAMIEAGANFLVQSGYLSENELAVDASIMHLTRSFLTVCLSHANLD